MIKHKGICTHPKCQNLLKTFSNSRRSYCSKQCRQDAIRIAKLSWREAPQIVNKQGYVYRKVEYGPAIAEHRLIMEEVLGRPLLKGETVHHRNGIRNDNRASNLELWLSGVRYGQRASDITCPHCGNTYSVVTP